MKPTDKKFPFWVIDHREITRGFEAIRISRAENYYTKGKQQQYYHADQVITIWDVEGGLEIRHNKMDRLLSKKNLANKVEPNAYYKAIIIKAMTEGLRK